MRTTKHYKTLNNAQQLIHSNNLPEAINLLEKICNDSKSSGHGWLLLSTAYGRYGQYDNAIKASKKAIKFHF